MTSNAQFANQLADQQEDKDSADFLRAWGIVEAEPGSPMHTLMYETADHIRTHRAFAMGPDSADIELILKLRNQLLMTYAELRQIKQSAVPALFAERPPLQQVLTPAIKEKIDTLTAEIKSIQASSKSWMKTPEYDSWLQRSDAFLHAMHQDLPALSTIVILKYLLADLRWPLNVLRPAENNALALLADKFGPF